MLENKQHSGVLCLARIYPARPRSQSPNRFCTPLIQRFFSRKQPSRMPRTRRARFLRYLTGSTLSLSLSVSTRLVAIRHGRREPMIRGSFRGCSLFYVISIVRRRCVRLMERIEIPPSVRINNRRKN